MEYWVVSWKWGTEMNLRRFWWMRLPEICLPYSKRLQQDQRWKLSLASKSETRGPLPPPTLHSGVHGHVPSSGGQ